MIKKRQKNINKKDKITAKYFIHLIIEYDRIIQ